MIGITRMTTEDLTTLGYLVVPEEYARQMAEIDAELQASKMLALNSTDDESPEECIYE